MISFYPGPSQLSDTIRQHLLTIYDSGILSTNHRSSEFVEVVAKTVSGLHQKLSIPPTYSIFFVSSATECWEIIAQSLVKHQTSLHLYNGAFGEKWKDSVHKITQKTIGIPICFRQQNFNDFCHLAVSLPITDELPLLCLTHTETSNGTMLTQTAMQRIRQAFAQYIIAVDATSSLGGVALDFTLADIWFGSVQKCLGLPAGLALMICSPKAVAQAQKIGDRRHYNSLLQLEEMAQKNQTTHTPNMLAICLLEKILLDIKPIAEVENRLVQRANLLRSFLQKEGYQLLDVDTPATTVLAVCAATDQLQAVKTYAKGHGILLGNGYGEWKNTTFRIANFPTLTDSHLEQLFMVLRTFPTNNAQ